MHMTYVDSETRRLGVAIDNTALAHVRISSHVPQSHTRGWGTPTRKQQTTTYKYVVVLLSTEQEVTGRGVDVDAAGLLPSSELNDGPPIDAHVQAQPDPARYHEVQLHAGVRPVCQLR